MSVNIIDDGGLGLIEELVKQFNALQADFAAHTHTIPAATYAQDTPTSVPSEAPVSQTINKII